ncbi:MAG: IS5 family transposase [Gammaproteobacteria bacterium]|nr:IS5 family transposase [Gammaproteobacteria bacterium]NIR98703.1 IS5 family transposase [Gammaproteobacteria bacterium]NIT64421.1 IS5 family transposase [Gammaproteobacteria bacterium]NIV21343.1 IS5 family transposase [Gammaproteobacteria bacterium]NIY33001.1 IS5 family transposase [Gammaproteobacteria bacterium]
MRGQDAHQAAMFSYLSPEERVPADHPLRPLRALVDKALAALSPRFSELYSPIGRPGIPPERLLRALLLQVLYSVRSERLLMEQLDYNLLFRWFVGLNMDDAVWDVTVFTKNRDRLLEGDVAEAFFAQVLAQARSAKLLSDEHFTVDGTLIEAWAGHKSFRRKDGTSEPPGKGKNPDANFRKEKRSNKTHAATTDPDARLYRKSDAAPAQLCYQGHVLMENRHGLAVGARLTRASGTAEREAAVELVADVRGNRRVTLGGDKHYDTRDFVDATRSLNVTPHVAQNITRNRTSAIDGRTTRHPGYAVSMRKRKRIEEIFGWLKTVGVMRKTRHRGIERVSWMFTFSLAAYNLVRMRNLLPAT